MGQRQGPCRFSQRERVGLVYGEEEFYWLAFDWVVATVNSFRTRSVKQRQKVSFEFWTSFSTMKAIYFKRRHGIDAKFMVAPGILIDRSVPNLMQSGLSPGPYITLNCPVTVPYFILATNGGGISLTSQNWNLIRVNRCRHCQRRLTAKCCLEYLNGGYMLQ